jgi:sulfur-carrier protein
VDAETRAGTSASTRTSAGPIHQQTEGRLAVTVRYFAGAAAAAGRQEEVVAVAVGSTLGALLARLADERGDGLARVLQASSFLFGEVHAEATDQVFEGGTLDVLPPFAGG